MRRFSGSAIVVGIAISISLFPFQTQAAKPPAKVGQCTETFVAKVGTRLVDGTTGQAIAGSGTAIEFTNGVALVSYDTIANAEASRPGDRVKMCLQSIPQNCPPGDNRGRVYQVSDYKTGKRFALPDSAHMCGGA
jgi:hypothetical protein